MHLLYWMVDDWLKMDVKRRNSIWTSNVNLTNKKIKKYIYISLALFYFSHHQMHSLLLLWIVTISMVASSTKAVTVVQLDDYSTSTSWVPAITPHGWDPGYVQL